MNDKVREAVARAIWNIRRDEEDRCDMELEDMGSDHSVLAEADAAISAIEVELPYVPQLFSGSDDFNDGVSACKESIESLGIKVKP